MKKTVVLLLLVLLAIDTQAGQKLIACGHQDYPPFMWRDGEQVKGVGADIAISVFAELHIKVDVVYAGNWKRCLYHLRQGSVDMIVAGYITDERSTYAEFTEVPLSPDPSAIFVNKGKKFIFEDWDDLKGKSMVSLLGDSQGQEFDDFISKFITDTDVHERRQIYGMLSAGKVDFTPSGLYAGMLQLKKYGYQNTIIALEKPLAMNYLHMAFSKRSEYLRYMPYLNYRLGQLTASGEIEQMIHTTIDNYIKTYQR